MALAGLRAGSDVKRLDPDVHDGVLNPTDQAGQAGQAGRWLATARQFTPNPSGWRSAAR